MRSCSKRNFPIMLRLLQVSYPLSWHGIGITQKLHKSVNVAVYTLLSRHLKWFQIEGIRTPQDGLTCRLRISSKSTRYLFVDFWHQLISGWTFCNKNVLCMLCTDFTASGFSMSRGQTSDLPNMSTNHMASGLVRTPLKGRYKNSRVSDQVINQTRWLRETPCHDLKLI